MFGKEKKARLTTLEEIRKAYESLSDEDKKSFKQSLSDRVDESVGMQEKDSGTEDSQTAKGRVNEAEGMEKADKADAAEASASESPKSGEELEAKDIGESEPSLEETEEKTEEMDSEEDDAKDARISALEEQIAQLNEKFAALLDGKEENESFGVRLAPPSIKGDDLDDERIMNDYYKNNGRAWR